MSSIDQTIADARATPLHDTDADVPAFDPQAARERLDAARGPVFWRSLEELSDDAGFRHWLQEQHPRLAETMRMDRRGFLKVLGASLALAGLTACSRPPRTEMVPYVEAPEGQTDGLPRFFATALPHHGHAHGVLVESNMGRPTKVEGNPAHPASLGATDIFAQAAVLELWDPDRSQTVMRHGVPSTWNAFDTALLERRRQWEQDGGAGVRILTGTVTSPTQGARLDALLAQYPRARWHVHEPAESIPPADASIHYRLDRARVIVALDADFLADPVAGVRYAHDFAMARTPGDASRPMSRLYAFEPTPTLTGSMADHRLAMASHQLHDFARQLAARLDVDAGDGSPPAAEPSARRWLDALADDLASHRGASLVVVGPTQPPWMHALGHALNAALGNVGHSVLYTEPVDKRPGPRGTLKDLADAMQRGVVDTLLVIDTNPVYTAPDDLDFVDRLGRVAHVLHLGLYRDETAHLAEWHLPMAHPLESWGDLRAYDGTASLMQPLIAPLYDGRTASEVLAQVVDGNGHHAHDLVRRQWRHRLADDAAWNGALQAGIIDATALPQATPTFVSSARRDAPGHVPETDELELLFRVDPTVGDGRWANNGWLQELPKPLTTLTWDNAALISPQLAEKRHLSQGDMVDLQVGQRRLRLPVWIMPGQAAHSVTVHLGYGRRHAGHVGDGRGFDAYALRSSRHPWSMPGLQLTRTGERYSLAATQHHFNMEGRDLLRVGTLAQFLGNPQFATAHDKYPEPPPSLYKDYPPGEYAWAMSIDLNSCIGCSACTVACQAENNIPVVGKDQVQRGREMHWIRIDRYFEGGPDDPRSYAQPVTCMMCEHAPCEVVCPVGATLHDSEGLNLQVYNRCVGTRFCSNNCPYKVRRFNFLQYADKTTESLRGQRNPEVSVRRRGVMEKCTYCIQRIETAHITADREGRRIADGDVVTACQAACPTRAIRFGDQSDPDSAVAQAKASPREYTMLNELGTRPRTTYLARVRNPNPALEADT